MGWPHIVIVTVVFAGAHWHLSRQLRRRERAVVEREREARRRHRSLDAWSRELDLRERCADMVDAEISARHRREAEAERLLGRALGPATTSRRSS